MLEPRVIERIARDFPKASRALVTELLSNYAGPESGRVTWDILELSRGSLEDARRFVEIAQRDYRDILYWAEYYETDPLWRGRDPKKLADEILAKWGAKKT